MSEFIQSKGASDRGPAATELSLARAELLQLFDEFDFLKSFHDSAIQGKREESTLEQDDLLLGPFLLSTQVEWGLASSRDHLETITNLVASDSIPSMAVYTLARASLEHSSLVISLLDPDERDYRLRAALLQTARFARVSDKPMQALSQKSKISVEKQLDRISELVQSNQLLSLKKGEIGRPGVQQHLTESGALLQKLVSGTHGVNLVLAMWAAGSGIAHGSPQAGLSLLARELVPGSESAISGTFRMSTTHVEISQIFQVALRLLEVATQLTAFRMGAVSKKYVARDSFGPLLERS